MSLNHIVNPISNQALDIKTNSIHATGSLIVTCTEDQLELDLTPNLCGTFGQVLARDNNGSVEFITLDYVTNPLAESLNIGSFDVIGLPLGQTLRGLNIDVLSQQTAIDTLNIKTQNINSLDFDYTSIVGNLTVDNKLLVPEITDILGSSSIALNTGGIDMTVAGTLNVNGNPVLTTPFGAEIEASGFKVTGGLSNQYLLADGSTITQSAVSGNSNFYLYNSNNSLVVPPSSGQIRYNNAVQKNATIVYISHLSSDSIDIERFFSNVSVLNDLFIQDRNNSLNFIQYNITGSPTIVSNNYMSVPVVVSSFGGTGETSFGLNHATLLSFFVNGLETDQRLSSLETKTQQQSSTAGNTFFSGILTANSIKVLGGLSSDFLKGNGSLDSNIYAISSGIQINSSVPYINASGQISSNISNLYVQQGNNTIASAISAVQTGVGYSIQLSASSFSENLTLNKSNYIIAGTDSPLFSPTTQITGNTLIGSSTVGAVSTRIKIKDIKFIGNLEFISSTYNELRSNISNCEITGTLIFPAVSGGGITWIYFFDCTIGGAITIPNQATYGIVFTRCNFAGQTITNSLTVGNTANLVYRECTGFSSLSLGNSVQYGMNATILGVSKSSAGSFVKDLATSNDILLGNGSTILTTSFVSKVPELTYGGRKFSLTSSISGSGILTNFNMMSGTYIPATGYNSLANEAVAGDTYKLTVYGSSFNAVNMSFTIGLLNSTHTVSGAITSAVTAPYVIEMMYTIRAANSLCVNFFLNSYFTTVSQGQFGYSASTVIPCNTTISSAFTMTYTCTGNGTFAVNQMSLVKL